MYKSILVILLAGLLAVPAMAQVPDPPQQPGQNVLPGGWGNNPNNWSHVTDEVCAWTKGVWDPVAGDWVICPIENGGNDMCQTITVELWIELFATMTVRDFYHEIHTVSDVREYREFCGYIRGFTASNHPLNIVLSPGFGQNLSALEFQHSVLDDPNEMNPYYGARDIPVNWSVACGYGTEFGVWDPDLQEYVGGAPDPEDPVYTDIGPFDIGEAYTMLCIDSPCDWWWYFKFCFRVYYHEDDGYYVLYFNLCPTPRV